MFGQTEAITTDMVKLALDAASLRHQAIANNIANVDTAGYAPARVDFERQLDAVRTALIKGDDVKKEMLTDIRPVIKRSAPETEGDRTARLDIEVANLAQNTIQYQALLKALNKQMSLISSAIAEGKR